MQLLLISVICKITAFLSKFFGLGAGVTWPGELSLRLDKNIIKKLVKNISKGVILIAGTNGKTTTAAMITQILENDGNRVIHNQTGANLLNGISGSLILQTDFRGKLSADYAIFEVDEASLPLILQELTPKMIILLNLFRDQLDRYGEVDMVALKWLEALKNLSSRPILIANADDPLIAYIAGKNKGKKEFFGLERTDYKTDKLSHATDSIFCLECGRRLNYRVIYLSHFGEWYCSECPNKRPTINLSQVKSPLSGVYNFYNTLAAVLSVSNLGIDPEKAQQLLGNFKAVFGRQEVFDIDGKKVQIYLSKNPAGFNESTRTVLQGKTLPAIMFVLNDRIPDGRDVSWIWDVDIGDICEKAGKIIVSGDRAYEMALRVKYALKSQKSKVKSQNLKSKDKSKLVIKENPGEALAEGLESINEGETLYIFSTYSAMLEVRKIITGKKIN